MSVSSSSDTLNSSQESKDIETNKPNLIDLNDILSDLKKVSNVVNNLVLALSIYLEERGELDTTRFKLVPVNQNKDQI